MIHKLMTNQPTARRLRVGLITTLNTNIGDDFIREGICLVLRDVLRGHEPDWVAVNKHYPFSVYPRWHPINVPQFLPRGRYRASRLLAKAFHRIGLSRFDDCDFLIQCGTPVVWHGCSQCDWAEPLWLHVVGRLARRNMPVINLGAGADYAWERRSACMDDGADAAFARHMLSFCELTTVRDPVAQTFFRSLGVECELIPCPALLPGRQFLDGTDHKGFVAVNYMEKGGHGDFGQSIDRHQWRNTILEVVRRLRRRHRVVLVCHNAEERELARAVAPDVSHFLPRDVWEYLAVMSWAKVGLCNRMHAAVALAGMGIPSVAVGVDSRMLMVGVLGLPYVYVKEATAQRLESLLHTLLHRRAAERERLLRLRDQAYQRYRELLEAFIERHFGEALYGRDRSAAPYTSALAGSRTVAITGSR